MRLYETVVVLRPSMTEAEQDAFSAKVTEDLTGAHASEVKLSKWGKKSLAYPIQKFKDAVFQVFEYSTPDGLCVEAAERRLRIHDDVLRYLSVRRDEEMEREQKLRVRLNAKDTPASVVVVPVGAGSNEDDAAADDAAAEE